MNVVLHHFKFRFQQLFRVWNWEPKMGLTFLIISLAVIMVKLDENAYYPVLFSFPILSFHFSRKDLLFLKKIFPKHWQMLIFSEYSLLYCLFVLANIHYKINLYSFIPLLAFAGLVFINPIAKKQNFHLDFIPNVYLEWKSYFRQYFWLAIIGYFFMIAGAYHRSTLVFSLLMFYGVLANIFQFNENKEMLIMFFQKYSLKQKIFYNLIFLNLLILPVLVLFFIINFSDFYYGLGYFIFFNLFLMLIITRKYKVYHHKTKQSYFDIGTSFSYLIYSATLIPAIFIILKNYKDAEQKIKSYVGN